MSDLKKVTDLIVIEPAKDAATQTKEMLQKIGTWQRKLKDLQEQYFDNKNDTESEDVTEIMAIRKFLTQFVKHRVDWIGTKVPDKKRQAKYLQLLPPFYQKGGLKLLILHFFQVTSSEDQQFLQYKAINEEEREIRVLWDLYKLNKTIESIDVIYKIQSNEGFNSVFPKDEQVKILQELKTVFRLMFQMCVQPAHQKELYRGITEAHISPEAILKRKEEGKHYLYPHVLKKFNYRNHFFFIYFYSGMKAKIGGELKTFTYNFLDFEILKQEFLIHWLTKTLNENPQKMEVFARYSYNGQTVAEIIAADPSKEIEILQQLPLNVFNDLAASVNSIVPKELSSAVEAMSENFGEFSDYMDKFKDAKKMAKAGVSKLKDIVKARLAAKEEVLEEAPAFNAMDVPDADPPAAEEAASVPELVFVKLKKKEIDFPFYVKTIADFQKNLNVQRARFGAGGYKELAMDVTKIFNSISENSLIQRRTPKYEWILPYLVKENTGKEEFEHMVLIGAEVKAKQLSMGYSAASSSSGAKYQFTPFFVYGRNIEDPSLGASVGTRNIRGKTFYEYNGGNPEVMAIFKKFFDQIKSK
ncbi:MAG: hypothetical protein QNL04_06295 [SAR324 cluster bacterium]|nr:hypothetical protein [SAR324 cluster bacterium]